MSQKDLYEWIDSLTQDIDFQYKGRNGSICPFNRINISLCFDGTETTVHSISEAMNVKFIDGKSLYDLCEVLEFD
jgi:hypothetical protein